MHYKKNLTVIFEKLFYAILRNLLAVIKPNPCFVTSNINIDRTSYPRIKLEMYEV